MYSGYQLSDNAILAYMLRQFIVWLKSGGKVLVDHEDFADEASDICERIYFDRSFLRQKYIDDNHGSEVMTEDGEPGRYS